MGRDTTAPTSQAAQAGVHSVESQHGTAGYVFTMPLPPARGAAQPSVSISYSSSAPDTDGDLGVRDRAILETLYSTGMRRMELIGLRIYDTQAQRATDWILATEGIVGRSDSEPEPNITLS